MPNINPIVLIVALLAAFIIYDKGKAFYGRWQETRRARTSALNSVAEVLAKAATLQEQMLGGAIKACEAIAVETAKHRASVDAFAKLVFKQETDKDKDRDAVQAPSEADKDLFYSKMEHRAAGKTAEEAKALAEEEALAGSATAYPSE